MKLGLITVAVSVLVSIVGCAGADGTEQSSAELRSQCSIDAFPEKDIILDEEPLSKNATQCQLDVFAELAPPAQCTREYKVTLYNGDESVTYDTAQCKGDCYGGTGQGPTAPGSKAFADHVVTIARGSERCFMAVYEDVVNGVVTSTSRHRCFSC